MANELTKQTYRCWPKIPDELSRVQKKLMPMQAAMKRLVEDNRQKMQRPSWNEEIRQRNAAAKLEYEAKVAK